MNTKDCIKTLDDLLRLPSYHRLNTAQIEHLSYLSNLHLKLFTNRNAKKSPRLGIRVTLTELQRVRDSSVVDIILYTMQINKSPVSFKETYELISKLKKRNVKNLVHASFHNLVKRELIRRIRYAVYELTEAGKNELV